MTAIENPHVDGFREALLGWTDSRFVSRDELYALTMFAKYLVNLAEADGWTYDGHSWKEKAGMGTLTVRGTVEGIPHVVFTSGRSYAGSMVIFLRKLEENWLEWVLDRYRQ